MSANCNVWPLLLRPCEATRQKQCNTLSLKLSKAPQGPIFHFLDAAVAVAATAAALICLQATAAVAELRQEASRKETELEAVRSSWQCRVCFSRDVEQAFVGCGHMYCGDCMPSLPRCPVCRKASSKIRLFR